jgi:hypothetical protein
LHGASARYSRQLRNFLNVISLQMRLERSVIAVELAAETAQRPAKRPDVMPDAPALHPNEKGYQIWADAIIDKVKELMAME